MPKTCHEKFQGRHGQARRNFRMIMTLMCIHKIHRANKDVPIIPVSVAFFSLLNRIYHKLTSLWSLKCSFRTNMM